MEASQPELKARFAAMHNRALLQAAEDRDELTEGALELLLSELRGRSLAVPALREREEQSPETIAWTTVERFRDLSSAIVARSALQAAGIACFLRDENTVRLDWQISNFIGGMRLQVPESEAAAALEMLAGMETEQDPVSDTGAALPDERCPQCDSTDIHRQAQRRGMALAALWLLSIPISTGDAQWQCDRCGARWTDDGHP